MDLPVHGQSLILARGTISHGLCTSDGTAETFFPGKKSYLPFHTAYQKGKLHLPDPSSELYVHKHI